MGDKGGTILDNILKTDKLEVSDLAGSWKSTGPAISFKSENLLEKAGGVGMATTIENKLAPYYKKVGLENAVFTFTKDGNVTITLASGKKINGTVELGDEDGIFYFSFGKLGSLGKLKAYISKGTTLSIMFDATKLMKFIAAIGKYTGKSGISTIASFIDNYEGMYAGFKFNKQ